ncbi:helix-turn-helix domain-containing protein [Xenorhabdus griffiniae]|uniref:helix-turn-helix domain-containing protein n=1 Tax=Xenorhabdus griffiniae TaxID=351672 RepID=UPI00235A0742|nr:XRE family transcriptional regulator [Xenorhabdus griffiniae]MDC9606814.1 XRE family transcriptional regulator [Xenorhabdus griffiniae]
MSDITSKIAEKFKSLRASRGLSLSQVAKLTGVSKAMLGQIERGQSSPTISTLWKIATGFNIAFSTFLEGAAPQSQPVLHRFNDLPIFEQNNSGMRVTPLIPFDDELFIDLFKIELVPGASSESSPHEFGVIEHVIVLSGELDLRLNDTWHKISAGESMRFHADCHHAYANSSDNLVVIHNLIHYPHNKILSTP